MFRLPGGGTMTSTLVETVSLNYEDFNDSFLTCGTCLSLYDGQENTPKLLPCSHTVCRSCLEHIVAAQARDSTTFRCPICRETITIPRGGVTSLPPSFIVNQLLDLMSSQRRDIVPKCSNHPSQELLFCETCDTVFCVLCSGGAHNGRGASAHTVIPFSIAIKRMSEILLYKASQCMKNLNNAGDAVSAEIQRLDSNAEQCLDAVSATFQDLINLLDRRRLDVIEMVQTVRDDKRRVLEEQLSIIDGEKQKVQDDCDGLQHQIEVRNITKKISDLNEKLDVSTTLAEPRENAFMRFEYEHNTALHDLVQALSEFGRIQISKTFPALCTGRVDTVVTHLRSRVQITTVDYHGNPRTSGSDPVQAEITSAQGDKVPLQVKDHDNGIYTISFVIRSTCPHKLAVKIFDRAIRDSPFPLQVTEHNNPIVTLGGHGAGVTEFIQPVQCIVDCHEECIYVLDTGNSRIKVLDMEGNFLHHITAHGLEQRSCTGMSLAPNRHLVLVNWRTREVSEINNRGDCVKKFTCDAFREPTGVTVNRHSEVIVADNGRGCLFIFSPQGQLLRCIGAKGSKPGQFQLISDICASPINDDIIVTDSRVQVFTRTGDYLRELPKQSTDYTQATPTAQATPTTPSKGTYGGVCIDQDGAHVLVTRSEKGRSCVQVYSVQNTLMHSPRTPQGGNSPRREKGTTAQWMFNIDSVEDKLKRPSGLATLPDGKVVVVDLGNDAVKIYRYK